MSFLYRVHGLDVRSDFPIPELFPLPPGNESNPREVAIRKGRCELPTEVRSRERYAQLQAGVADFYWRGAGSFRVTEREIIVDPDPGVADGLLRPFLLGSILATVLHLRLQLVLHCSAVALPSQYGSLGVAAFLGHSGMGKSTMATALKERGHFALSDDFIAVPTPIAGPAATSPHESAAPAPDAPLIWAGPPFLKLRPPSLQTFGASPATLSLWHPDEDSYVIAHPGRHGAPLPLRALYVLEVADEVAIQIAEPQNALMALVNNSYCIRGLDAEHVARNFYQCSWLANHIPVFHLQRPRDFDYLPTVVAQLEVHQRSL